MEATIYIHTHQDQGFDKATAIKQAVVQLVTSSFQSVVVFRSLITVSCSYVACLYTPCRTDRYCKETTVINGATVIVPIALLHYSPLYWTDPEKFDPDRLANNC